MELVIWLEVNWLLIVAAWGGLTTLASAITAMTPTPADDAALAKLYKIIERIALVVGRTKDEPKE